jgi:hypothetical protein
MTRQSYIIQLISQNFFVLETREVIDKNPDVDRHRLDITLTLLSAINANNKNIQRTFRGFVLALVIRGCIQKFPD